MTGEPSPRDALEHLQRAGLELVAAARSFLDIAEDLLRDPAAASAVVQTVSAFGEVVRTAAEQRMAAAAQRTHTPEDEPGGDSGAVEHIPVS